MSEKTMNRIIIAHGAQEVREALCAVLSSAYEILTVTSGKEVVSILSGSGHSISLLLLGTDLLMGETDVLGYMNRHHWLDEMPVLLVGECAAETVDQACAQGAMDHIAPPLEAQSVLRRTANAIRLYAQQRRLTDLVTNQMYHQEKSNKLMVSILSHIVEFRNGESGPHVVRIGTITEMLLNHLVQKTDKYHLSMNDISNIATASALHDIGKISVPEEILNKVEPLSEAEFQLLKTHSEMGAKMLDNLPFPTDEPLVRAAREICHWHHERYDGRGYPDGLKGDEIPIAAQVVAIADVYDALVSERSYKGAFTHRQAIQMIMNGQCGAFQPLLLECLDECSAQLEKTLYSEGTNGLERREIKALAGPALEGEEMSATAQLLRKLECERLRSQFFAEALPDITFSFDINSMALQLSPEGATRLGLDASGEVSITGEETFQRLSRDTARRIIRMAQNSTPEHPHFSVTGLFLLGGKEKWCRCSCRALWTAEARPTYAGVVGRLIDLEERCGSIEAAEEAAYRDALMLCLQEGDEENGARLTGQQTWQLCRYLNVVFDSVRLVDLRTHMAYKMDVSGSLIRETEHCYRRWNQNNPCENCLAERVLEHKGRVSKFEFSGEDLYHVSALYLEVDSTPYALELISRVSDETLMSGYAKNQLAETLERQNQQLYADPLTGVYNNRYYEEQLHGLEGVDAVVRLNVDHFGHVNDAYGYQAGDAVLRTVAQTILSLVRRSDSLVRYKGDEFLLVFRTIPLEVLERKLEMIRSQVEKTPVVGYPQLQVSLSIGGKYGAGKVAKMMEDADRCLQHAKKTHNQVCIDAPAEV